MSKERIMYIKELLDENFEPKGVLNPFSYMLGMTLGARTLNYAVLSNGNVVKEGSGELIGKQINGKVIPISKVLNGKRIKEEHDKITFVNTAYPFELVKHLIGITDKNTTQARRTLKEAWRELKDAGLIEGYSYKVWTSKKDNIEYIKIIFTGN